MRKNKNLKTSSEQDWKCDRIHEHTVYSKGITSIKDTVELLPPAWTGLVTTKLTG